jgi:hypothetical protein
MSIPRVKVPITLDRERHVVLSFNALCDVEKAIGRNPFAMDADSQIDLSSPNTIRAYLWAGLRHEDPTLTLEQTGDLLESTEGGWVSAMAAIAQALEAALPDEERVADDVASAEGNE